MNDSDEDIMRNELREGHELNTWLHINRVVLADDQAVNLEVLSNYLRAL